MKVRVVYADSLLRESPHPPLVVKLNVQPSPASLLVALVVGASMGVVLRLAAKKSKVDVRRACLAFGLGIVAGAVLLVLAVVGQVQVIVRDFALPTQHPLSAVIYGIVGVICGPPLVVKLLAAGASEDEPKSRGGSGRRVSGEVR